MPDTPEIDPKLVARQRFVRGLVVDSSILLGAGLVSFGAWQLLAPAGYITLGVLLLAFGTTAARRAP